MVEFWVLSDAVSFSWRNTTFFIFPVSFDDSRCLHNLQFWSIKPIKQMRSIALHAASCITCLIVHQPVQWIHLQTCYVIKTSCMTGNIVCTIFWKKKETSKLQISQPYPWVTLLNTQRYLEIQCLSGVPLHWGVTFLNFYKQLEGKQTEPANQVQ